jgi:hypothetical protein
MIPGVSCPDTLIPLDIDVDPLIDKQDILSKFDINNTDHQVLHLTDSILKSNVLAIFNSRDLYVDKIDVWRWNLSNMQLVTAHTDGNYKDRTARQVGMNWSLSDDASTVDFYDTSKGTYEFENLVTRSHATWSFPEGTLPMVQWNNRYPSLLNTQVPHNVTGPVGNFRYSMTIKFKDNPTFKEVSDKLWDLRLDLDWWETPITDTEWDAIKNEVISIEQIEGVVPDIKTKISSYRLPTEHAPNIKEILDRRIKRKLKSLRIFIMKPGYKAGMHIDYDQWLKIVPRYALNIPLYGCEDSFVEFHRNTGEQGTDSNEETGVGGYLYPKDYDKVFFNSKLNMLTPKLVRIDVPHVVDNFSTHERKILSIRFFEEVGDLPSNII